MGVHAAGGIQHLALGFAAQRAQGGKGLRGRAVCHGQARSGTGFKVGVQGGSAVHKRIEIHIFMAAAVPAVHQTGLGRGGHLIQNGPHRLSGDLCRIPCGDSLCQKGRGLCLQFRHRVDAAAAAHLGGAAADEALPALQMQLLPVHLCSVRAQDIHIEEPPQRGGILNGCGDLLDGQGGGIQHIKGLAAGGSHADIGVQRGQPRPEKLLAQKLPPHGKPPPDQRRILHRACNVHGKTKKGLVVLLKQFLLVLHPALTGIQHLQKRNLRGHDGLSSLFQSGSILSHR